MLADLHLLFLLVSVGLSFAFLQIMLFPFKRMVIVATAITSKCPRR